MPKGFYGITDERYGSIESAEKLIDFGVEIIQYRCKYKSDRVKYEEAKAIKEMIGNKDIVYIIDDRLDLALVVGADGVHVGDKDIPAKAIRNVVPKGFIIGFSTHSESDVINAEYCDYIGVGPIFYTATKDDVREPIGIEEAERMVGLSRFPTYLIGGIRKDNIDKIKHIKSTGFISVSDVLNHDKGYFEEMVNIWMS